MRMLLLLSHVACLALLIAGGIAGDTCIRSAGQTDQAQGGAFHGFLAPVSIILLSRNVAARHSDR
jgi:hypothetical protein